MKPIDTTKQFSTVEEFDILGVTPQQIQVALLKQILDELKKLNLKWQ